VSTDRAREAYLAGSGSLAAAARAGGVSRRTCARAAEAEGWETQRAARAAPPAGAAPPDPSRSQRLEQVELAREGTAVVLLTRLRRVADDPATSPGDLARVAVALSRLRPDLPRAAPPPAEQYREARAERERSALQQTRGDLVAGDRVALALAVLRHAWDRVLDLARSQAPGIAEEVVRIGREAGARVRAELPEVDRWGSVEPTSQQT
jgi:hypothetical protein